MSWALTPMMMCELPAMRVAVVPPGMTAVVMMPVGPVIRMVPGRVVVMRTRWQPVVAGTHHARGRHEAEKDESNPAAKLWYVHDIQS